MAGSTTGGGSACAACKYLRRKCIPECPFAPYFPAEHAAKFAAVHKIFGVSNITKMLNDLPEHAREDAVSSLAYEADARVKDPVYGCVAAISILQQQVLHLQAELGSVRSELLRWQSLPPSSSPARLPSTGSSHHSSATRASSVGEFSHMGLRTTCGDQYQSQKLLAFGDRQVSRDGS